MPGAWPGISMSTPAWQTARLFAGELPDQRLEARELLLDEVDAGLVGEFHLVVELGVRGTDEDLRRIEGERIKKHHPLADLILHAPTAHRSAPRGLAINRLFLSRAILEKFNLVE